ncbi:Midasin [Wickerhamomyces ciferrii]|uniref:Midasin n=1 Tax=Wickerhamomyces ciferrii (strain ATCC 14091 / BCRC 22168 / CBS 111 / JCM 3599 / NBRC 0793 / NRRL Y-1031 F-60-10) TaxID=1206466 RepID=K0KUI1_WICCF|nr:Midasin [Wickerhamomyces ciferrii]CCH46821.1 Midasin [Wickerhamomyces ciferrii]
MRSFIKTHRRGSSTNIGDGGLPDLNTSSSTTDLASEDKHNSTISANSSTPSSPIRQSTPSSPSIVNKSKKLHRLFQRNKTSSQNLFNLSSPLSPNSPKKSPPPSIIGTRTHEWGNNNGDNSSKSTGNKNSGKSLNPRSSQSSSNSFLSDDEIHQLSTTSTSSRDPFSSTTHITNENESIQLPLNTVLEIPNENLLGPIMREIPGSKEMDKKNRHRRAQIISTDSFKLEDPPEIIPIAELQKQKEISTPEMFNDGFIDPDETVAETIHNEKLRQKRESQIDSNNKDLQDNEQDENEYQSDNDSEFSFEQDNKQGRNVSIRYYKSPAEDLEERQIQNVKEQGFYVNDLIDDDFDEDLNYYDEYGDDYNDDEEIFNKRYFSDEEDDTTHVNNTVGVVDDKPQITPENSINIDQKENQSPPVGYDNQNEIQDEDQDEYYDDYDEDDFNDDEDAFNNKYFSDDEEDIEPMKRSLVNPNITPENSFLDNSSKIETPLVENFEDEVTHKEEDDNEGEDIAAGSMLSSLLSTDKKNEKVINENEDETKNDNADEDVAARDIFSSLLDSNEKENENKKSNVQNNNEEKQEEEDSTARDMFSSLLGSDQIKNKISNDSIKKNNNNNDDDDDDDDLKASSMFSSLLGKKNDNSMPGNNKDNSAKPVYPSHKNGSFHGSHLQLDEAQRRPNDDLLKPRKLLKYHQISTSLDQDVPQNRYSWLSEDEDFHNNNNLDGINSSFSFDSLLDEINNIPEDLEFGNEKPEQSQSRSRSMNSSIKRNKGVYEDLPQNTKFENNNKTVTLFNRPSRQNSIKSNNSSEFQNNNNEFGYLTPNGSFTLPNPMFANNQNNELSPITEGSIDGSP